MEKAASYSPADFKSAQNDEMKSWQNGRKKALLLRYILWGNSRFAPEAVWHGTAELLFL